MSKPPFVPPLPQTHESALANSAFSNVVIVIRILVYYYFHAIVGAFLAGPCGDALFSGKAQSLHLNVGCNLLFPLKGRFCMFFVSVFVDSHFCSLSGIWVILLIECLEVMEAAVLCRLWGILLTWGTELWNFRVLCAVRAVNNSSRAVEAEEGSCTQNEQSSTGAAVLAAFI